MSEAWKTYRGAPDEGAIVCASGDVVEGSVLCLELEEFPILLIRQAGEVRAFVNACPHQYLPLNRMGDQVLSADGSEIRCTNHSAGYDARTGEGVAGLGLGNCLDPVPIEEKAGLLIVSG